MLRTNISHQHRLLLDLVSAKSIPLARVDRVLKVEAFADCISLDYFVAHVASSLPVVSGYRFRIWTNKVSN